MTGAYFLAAAVVLLLGAGGAFGGRALEQVSGTLSARPRLGLTLWLVATGAWTALFLALGPVLAWFGARQLLPGRAGEVCQRCLAATNPFGGASGPLASVLPAVLFVLIPVLAMAVLAGNGVVRALRSQRTIRRHGRGLDIVGSPQDKRVWILPGRQIAAYSIPLGRGRIVLTQGTVDALDATELSAVIAHEQAHLTQRHHALLAWTRLLSQLFGWVPLLRAAAPAVAGFAEMAADDAASRTVADRVTVARALAKLQMLDPAPSYAGASALHAARTQVPSRVRRLISKPTSSSPAPRGWLAVIGAYVIVAAIMVGTVSAPYMSVAIMGGC